MTTTDPKLIERAMTVWLDAIDAYQDNPPTKFDHGIPNKSAAAVVAAAINEAVQKERAGIVMLTGALEQLIKHAAWCEPFVPALCHNGKFMGESLSLADARAAIEAHKESGHG